MKKIFLFLFSLATATFYSQSLSTSLTACYALNGNATEPINNLNGTLSAVTPTLDRFNNPNSAIAFNGTAASYIQLPNSSLLKPNLISFSGWVRFNAVNFSQILVFAHNGCLNYHEGYQIALANLGFGNSKFQVAKANNLCMPAGQTYTNGTTNVSANTWYHIGFYAGSDSLKLYVNGALEATIANPSTLTYNAAANVYLGGTNLAFNLPFYGSMDNAKFYNRKLSGTEFNQLYLTDPICAIIESPDCSKFYANTYSVTTSVVYKSSTGIPNTSTLSSLPGAAFAIAPPLGFSAPNPTFWRIDGSGFYNYYDGATYINTNHADLPGVGQKRYGGSKNFIYSLDQTGQVFAYNGTSTASLITSVPTSSNGVMAADIVGDDMDNFYILKTTNPQALLVYNHSGTQICSYSVSGIPVTLFNSAFGMAIIGNTVTAADPNNTNSGTLYYVGIMNSSSVNFTQTAQSFSIAGEFASCPKTVPLFSSTITASPNPSISCISQTITLNANATSTVVPGSYTWAGPGILTSANNQSVQVNMPGVYSCTLTSCPMAASVSSFTVLSGPAPITPTVSATNSLSCTAPTATLSVTPNLAPHTFSWSGPGIIGPLTSSAAVVNAGGVYTITVTNPSTGCSATRTINVQSSISTLTINAVASNTNLCSPSAPITMTATGATNYTWTPVGSTVPGTGAIVIANPAVTTTYSITGATGVCTGSTTITVSVTPTPTLNAGSNSPICFGSVATLTASGASSYSWFPGPLTGPSVTVSPTSTSNYTLIGTNGSCTAATIVNVIVLPAPTVTSSASPTIICQGITATLTAGGALTYTWQPVNLSGASVTVAPLVTTIYTVTGTNVLGCTATSTVQLVVNNPTIVVSPLSSTLCAGQSATLTATGATGYTWNPGGANTSSIVVTPSVNTIYTLTTVNAPCVSTNTIPIAVSPTPALVLSPTSSTICSGTSATLSVIGASSYTWLPGSITGSTAIVSPTINTNYTVTGTNSFGCSSTAVSSVVVNPNPTITVVASPTNICSASGSPVLLTASGGATYTWSPVSSNSSTLVVTPTVTTTYSVASSNTLGCVTSQTVSVLVSPTPTLTIVSTPTAICNGNSATLTASGANSYSWMPGTLTGTSVIVSPSVTTIYTVTGMSGICSSTKTFTLNVLANPTININAIPPVICNGGTALLLGSGATGYTWSPSNANTTTLVVTPSVTTTYTLIGVNASGCKNTANTTVTVNPTPTVSVNSSTNVVCSGTSATLTLNGALNYLTLPNAQTGSVVVISPTVNTTYTITGVNSFGCTDTETINIGIATGPTITATSSATLLCDGGTFSLSANGATNYTWMPVGNTGSTIATIASSAITVYTVVGETGGCTNTATVPVVVIDCSNKMFGMTKAASKPVLVYNTYYNVTFTVTAVNASTINLTNVSMDENLSAAFPSPTSFTVLNAPVITSQNSSLTINPLFDGGTQISLTSPFTSTLLANKRDTIVFTVRVDPKGYFGPFKNSVIGFAEFINNVVVSDSSNNGFIWDPDHDGDPTNNDTATVIDFTPIDLFIPDAFSPNGDGINDVFFVKGMNGKSVKLTVFNRWGNKVYEKSEYDNSWDAYPNVTGTFGSNKLPPATYYYVIEFLDGDKQTITGFVVVQY